MRVAVCLKYVPEIIEQNLDNGAVKREGVGGKINPSDLFAIEEAVRIKERMDASTFGLCMGVSTANESLKTAIAMGLDDVYLLSDKSLVGSDTLATSYALSKAITFIGDYNLILCGRQTADGDTGQIGQEISSYLNIPCVTNVVSIAFIGDKEIACKVLSEKGYSEYRVSLPCVVSVLKGINEPRIPTISGLTKSHKYLIKMLDLFSINADKNKCGIKGSPTKIKKNRQHKYEKRAAVEITDTYLFIIDDLLKNIKLNNDEAANNKQPTVPIVYKQAEHEIWIICERNESCFEEVSLQLLSYASKVAFDIDSVVCAFVFGEPSDVHFKELGDYGADKVYVANGCEEFLFNETLPSVLTDACRNFRPKVVFFGSTTFGRWLAPVVAAKLKTGLSADCLNVSFEGNIDNLIQTRTAFGGNIVVDIICPDHRPQMSTIRTNIYKKEKRNVTSLPMVVKLESKILLASRVNRVGVVEKVGLSSELSTASIVVAGGKGIGNKKNFELLFDLAKHFKASVAATRCAVDLGWLDYAYQVGQTGITVRPKLYFSFGISGAIEHLVGMRESDCVISVNIDPNATIHSYADYIIIKDCCQVIEQLMAVHN